MQVHTDSSAVFIEQELVTKKTAPGFVVNLPECKSDKFIKVLITVLKKENGNFNKVLRCAPAERYTWVHILDKPGVGNILQCMCVCVAGEGGGKRGTLIKLISKNRPLLLQLEPQPQLPLLLPTAWEKSPTAKMP